MENIFKIVERKRNHWEEHKYNSNKDKYRICTYIHYYDNETVPFYIGQGTLISKCIKNNKPFRGIIYWKRI